MIRFLAALTLAAALLGQDIKFSTTAPPGQSLTSSVAVGATGSTNIYYWVVTRYAAGASGPVGPFAALNTVGRSNFTTSNYVQLTWNPMQGATGYDILATTVSGASGMPLNSLGKCTCAVVINTQATTYSDQSTTLSSYTLPSAQVDGIPYLNGLPFTGNLQFPGGINFGSAVQQTHTIAAGPTQIPVASSDNVNQTFLVTDFATSCNSGGGGTAVAQCRSNGVNYDLVGLSLNSVDVKWFGATGDGVTNDTSAIQAAHTALCNAGGGSLLYSAGTYLVQPTSGAYAGTFRLCNNLHITFARGATVKVKANAGNFWALYQPSTYTDSVSHVSFQGPGGIDTNVDNNTTSTISVASASTTAQNAIYIAGSTSSDITVSGVSVAGSGINTITITATNTSITGGQFTFHMRSGQTPFDNSYIYLTDSSGLISSNSFTASQADNAVTAIEAHTGAPLITSNRIDWFQVGINMVAGPNADSSGANLVNNSIRDVLFGISLWSLTGHTLSNVLVANNNISDNQLTRTGQSSWGIATYFDSGTNGNFSNIDIRNNLITFEPETASRTVLYTTNYCIALQALGNINTANVDSNTCLDSPVRGIAVGVLDNTYTAANVQVSRNMLRDAGRNPYSASYNAGLVAEGNLSYVKFSHNIQRFTTNPFIGNLWAYSYETGYTFTNVTFDSNAYTAVNGTPVNGLTASVLTTNPNAIITGVCNGAVTSNTTIVLFPFQSVATTCNSTSTFSGPPVAAHTIKNLYVVSAAGFIAGSGIVTVYKNGVATALTCTLSTAASCSDTADSFSTVAGDRLTIKVTSNQLSDTGSTISASIELF